MKWGMTGARWRAVAPKPCSELKTAWESDGVHTQVIRLILSGTSVAKHRLVFFAKLPRGAPPGQPDKDTL